MQGTPLTHRILKQFDPLIHQVVRSRGFTPRHAYYHDFCQELRLHLLTLYDQFDGKPLGGDRYAFVAFAKRGLNWHLANYLRLQHPERDLSLTEIEDNASQIPHYTSDADYSLTQLLADLESQLAPDQFALLQRLIFTDDSVQEIATDFNVTRQTINNRKNRLKQSVKAWIMRQP